MSLTIFLAICILGIDVLIYFLYEWAFGESERIRKRRARSRFGTNPAQVTPISSQQPQHNPGISGRALKMSRQPAQHSSVSSGRPNMYQEALAYRRLAASFAPARPRS